MKKRRTGISEMGSVFCCCVGRGGVGVGVNARPDGKSDDLVGNDCPQPREKRASSYARSVGTSK